MIEHFILARSQSRGCHGGGREFNTGTPQNIFTRGRSRSETNFQTNMRINRIPDHVRSVRLTAAAVSQRNRINAAQRQPPRKAEYFSRQEGERD